MLCVFVSGAFKLFFADALLIGFSVKWCFKPRSVQVPVDVLCLCYRCIPDPVRVYVATGRVPAHVYGAEFRTVREPWSHRHIREILPSLPR